MGCSNSKEQNNNKIILSKNLKNNSSFKIVLLGDIYVGKTSIVNCFHNIENKNNYAPTIGFAYYEKNMIINNKNINLQIWDTSGDKTIRDLVSWYFRNAKVAILVFDLSNKNSFKNLIDWFNILYEKTNSNFGLFLVGNKCDLDTTNELKNEEIEELQKKLNITNFIKTSAKTGQNVLRLFELIAIYCSNN